MAYLDQPGYEARFGTAEAAQVIESAEGATLAMAIADAESIVDSYLVAIPNRTFAVPLQGTTPPRIVEITADLARYEIHAKKVTYEIKRRRNQAIAFLENLVKGLQAIPELAPVLPVEGGMDVTAEPRVFTSCTLRGYVGR